MRLIDADVLIESIKNTADLGGWIGEALYQIKQVAIKYIDSAPTIEPERGEWIRDRYWSRGVGMGEDYGFFYKCSLCEYEVENGYTRCGFNFCPYCGADMREVRDE